MQQDAADVVRAETGGQRGEARMDGVTLDIVVQIPAVAQEFADDMQQGSDARRDNPVLWR